MSIWYTLTGLVPLRREYAFLSDFCPSSSNYSFTIRSKEPIAE